MSAAKNPFLLKNAHHHNKQFRFYPVERETDDQGKPLVVLIGWFGSHYKYMVKYAQMYHKYHSCSVLAFIPPVQAFFSDYLTSSYMIPLLGLIQDAISVDQNLKICWHFQSNNGGYFLQRMVNLVLTNEKFAFIRQHSSKIICEAFPGAQQKDGNIIWVLAGFPYDHRQRKYLPESNVPFLTLIVRYFLAIVFWFIFRPAIVKKGFSTQHVYYKNLLLIPKAFPKLNKVLVLAAKSDWVVPYDQVEQFWREEYGMQHQNAVEIVAFTNPHLDHMKILPMEPILYANSVGEYLQAS